MVRIKHRYLLVQILSPTQLSAKHGDPSSASEKRPSSILTPKKHNNDGANEIMALHAPTSDTVEIRDLLRIIRNSLAQLFGDYGSSVAGGGLKIMYWSNATSTFIIRCRREFVRLVWAALCFLHSIPNHVDAVKTETAQPKNAKEKKEREAIFRVVRVSGTVRKSIDEAVRRDKRLMGRVKGMTVARQGLHTGLGTEEGDQALQEVLNLGPGSAVDADDGDADLDNAEHSSVQDATSTGDDIDDEDMT